MPLNRADYNILQQFIGSVLNRLEDGRYNHVEAVEEIMRPLTAWADGREDSVEFVPYMRNSIEEAKA